MVFMFFVEIISLASVLLVVSGGAEANRKAGLQYFVVDHLANLFILVAFLILVCHSHSFDFSVFVATPITGTTASWAFIFALFGFGIKAAGIGLHGWMPKIYPLAPSHSSTLISCVMVKLGIYGIIKLVGYCRLNFWRIVIGSWCDVRACRTQYQAPIGISHR